MENVIANLAGKARRATLNGREHLVAPLTLIVPGVLSGSKGALYYPPEEIVKNHDAWNHIPLVVYHPTDPLTNAHLSARDPAVLDRQGIGILLNVKANGKLTAEGWFDVESTRRIDNRVYEALVKGTPIELSTGLYTENEVAPEGANHKGRPYDFIARNYRPDHLAILPDQIGACSIKDGCGVLVNEEATALLVNYNENHDEQGRFAEAGGGGKSMEQKAKEHVAEHAHKYTAAQHASMAVAHEAAAKLSAKAAKKEAKPGSEQNLKDAKMYEAEGKAHAALAAAHREHATTTNAEEKQTIWQRLGEMLGVNQLGKGNHGIAKRAEHANALSDEAAAKSESASDETGHKQAMDAHKAAADAHRAAAKEAAEPSATGGEKDYATAGPHNVKAGYHEAKAEEHGKLAGITENAWDVYNRDWPKAKRDALDESDFAGPHQSFPIKTQADVDSAAKLIGHADDPEAVKARIKAIAKRKGLSIPEAWKETGTNNERRPTVAKLSDNDRKAAVDFITANCDCWSDPDDAKTLNALSDDKLVKLKTSVTASQEKDAVINAVKDKFGKELTVNAMPAALAKAAKAKEDAADKGADDDEEDASGKKKATKNQKTLTPEEWFELAPPDIQSAVRNAMERDKQDRMALIGRIVANRTDPNDRKARAEKLMTVKVEELREMVKDLGPSPATRNGEREPLPLYLGAAGSATTTNRDDAADDILELPTVNWKEWAEESA